MTELKSTLRGFKPSIHRKAASVVLCVHRAYMKMRCRYVGLWDRQYIKQTGFRLVPPASLRYRVHGAPDVDGFLKVGKQCSQDIEAALRRIGKNFGSFQHILDFGCGCGRTLIWFANRSPSSHLYGTDIDGEAISWCRNNLGFASFCVNDPLPPIEYPSEMFDLIYAISVFTHLDEGHQFRWLSELKRIAKPQAILLLTFHGYHLWKDLPEEEVIRMRESGIAFIPSNSWKGIFPDWYQTTYHSQGYIQEKYARYFDILDYIPRGLNDFQDMVVLQRS